jgi:acetoin utilization protein AcuB
MFVGERMSKPVITVTQDMPINEAVNLMQREKIRRAPVIHAGKMVGIVSEKDLLNASPSPATSLSVWEINYLLSKITVKDMMTKTVISVEEDTPIEAAARIMSDNKIGGLPVLRGGKLVGIITETDLFKILLELMGARQSAVRATVMIEEKPGQLAKITQAISQRGGNFISFGQFSGEDSSTRLVTFKVEGLEERVVKEILDSLCEKVVDIRFC